MFFPMQRSVPYIFQDLMIQDVYEVTKATSLIFIFPYKRDKKIILSRTEYIENTLILYEKIM